MDAITIRPLRADDGEVAGEIFFDAVHHGAADQYTLIQRQAWAGSAPNPSGWRDRLVDVDGFMAERDGTPIGFMTIDRDGYIDLAFVRSRTAGQGIGWRLYEAIEAWARQHGVTRLTTEASKKARPFFERQGWIVDEEQVVLKRNVTLTNFKMSKQLNAQT
jgi:putative acetyltransferase